jgi:hypothetical protein
MPNIDLSILNQRQTPAFFADTLANRPAPSFVGRIFISTDTLDLYRDTGSAWLLLSPSSTGTITGSGAAGQVTYFSGTSSITGSNDLFWDSVNGHLGIGTITPSTALTIFHDQNQIIQLNQTTATNDTKIAFQNSGTPLWRIGNSYNAGANDYGIFDVVGAIQPLTIKKTTGQTFIGAQTTSSGRLVVNDTTGDNHIVVIGATAPSLRINNSGSGSTKQIGIGLATATNNFIQGSVDRDMAIFNGSTTPSPILFGIYGTTNIQEAARISSSRNFLIGTSVDGGQRLQISGGARATGYYLDGMTAGSGALYYSGASNRVTLANYNAGGILLFEVNGGNTALTLNSDLSATFVNDITATGSGNIVIKAISSNNFPLFQLVDNRLGGAIWNIEGGRNIGNLQFRSSIFGNSVLELASSGASTFSGSVSINSGNALTLNNSSNTASGSLLCPGGGSLALRSYGNDMIYLNENSDIRFLTSNNERARVSSSGNLLIGTTTDAGYKLQVNGSAQATRFTSSETTINMPDNTATTIFTGQSGVFLVSIQVIGNGSQVGYAICGFRGASPTLYVLASGTGSQLSFSVSGTNLQATQTAGVALDARVSYISLVTPG